MFILKAKLILFVAFLIQAYFIAGAAQSIEKQRALVIIVGPNGQNEDPTTPIWKVYSDELDFLKKHFNDVFVYETQTDKVKNLISKDLKDLYELVVVSFLMHGLKDKDDFYVLDEYKNGINYNNPKDDMESQSRYITNILAELRSKSKHLIEFYELCNLKLSQLIVFNEWDLSIGSKRKFVVAGGALAEDGKSVKTNLVNLEEPFYKILKKTIESSGSNGVINLKLFLENAKKIKKENVYSNTQEIEEMVLNPQILVFENKHDSIIDKDIESKWLIINEENILNNINYSWRHGGEKIKENLTLQLEGDRKNRLVVKRKEKIIANYDLNLRTIHILPYPVTDPIYEEKKVDEQEPPIVPEPLVPEPATESDFLEITPQKVDDAFYFTSDGLAKKVNSEGKEMIMKGLKLQDNNDLVLFDSKFPDDGNFGNRYLCLYNNKEEAMVYDKATIESASQSYPIIFPSTPYSVNDIFLVDYFIAPGIGRAEAIVVGVFNNNKEQTCQIMRFGLTKNKKFEKTESWDEGIRNFHYFFNPVEKTFSWIKDKRLTIIQFWTELQRYNYLLPISPDEETLNMQVFGNFLLLKTIRKNQSTARIYQMQENGLREFAALQIAKENGLFVSIFKESTFIFMNTSPGWKCFRYCNNDLNEYDIPYPLAQCNNETLRTLKDIKMIKDGANYYLALVSLDQKKYNIDFSKLEDDFKKKPQSNDVYSIEVPLYSMYSFLVEGTNLIVKKESDLSIQRIFRVNKNKVLFLYGDSK
ncbi:MAG: hypothetical protein MUF15_14145 [Acidobacteria bacterium]|nr:hypothetical protein [Acidobacteriota bacterium]